MKIDLNCDMGEGLGEYQLGYDEEIMPYISSANIACGFHAGSPVIMERTVRMAKKAGVAIGAHPSYPDLEGFGRREMNLALEEVEAMVLYQIGALAAMCQAGGVALEHVKPHGALYTQAARDIHLAEAIARAVNRFSHSLVLVGLAGSRSIEAGLDAGLVVAREAFPDRAYMPDGSLMPRSLPGAVLEDPQQVMMNALQLAQEGIRVEKAGGRVELYQVDTLCLHGDNPAAVENARMVSQVLRDAGFEISPMHPQ
jgi:UPF0271 protein